MWLRWDSWFIPAGKLCELGPVSAASSCTRPRNGLSVPQMFLWLYYNCFQINMHYGILSCGHFYALTHLRLCFGVPFSLHRFFRLTSGWTFESLLHHVTSYNSHLAVLLSSFCVTSFLSTHIRRCFWVSITPRRFFRLISSSAFWVSMSISLYFYSICTTSYSFSGHIMSFHYVVGVLFDSPHADYMSNILGKKFLEI